jgi:hypothetical protein
MTYMGLESTVGVAKVGTNSVRTTVPEGITEFLEIRAGDKLDWKMEVQGTDRIAVVKKAGGIAKSTSKLLGGKLKGGKL